MYSLFLPQNWCLETMGEGRNEVMCRDVDCFFPERGKSRVWKGVADMCWQTVGDGW